MTNKLSHTEYQLLVEHAPTMIWRANTTMACDYFNEVWLAFTGRTPAQEDGDGWAEGVHPDDLERCLAIYTGSFARREAFEMEYRRKRHDGEYRWLFDRGVPFADDAGAFCGYIGSCVDVTDRRRAQDELARQQRDQMRELRGLLPICADCHRIRDDANYWVQLEQYISEHSQAEFSQGLCPDCLNHAMTALEGASPAVAH